MDRKYTIILSVVAVVLVIAIVGIPLWIILAGTEDSTKIISSAIAFWGGLITAIITLFGVLLKHSVDIKNNNLKTDAESRLKLEAGIKAIELLSQPVDSSSCENQRSAVLHMLLSLGMLDLALSLLRQMLSKGQIDALTASQIIDKGLEPGNERVNMLSSQIFRNYSKCLLTENGGAEVPGAINLKWPVNLDLYTRQHLEQGLMMQVVARPYKEWKRDSINGYLYTFCKIWQTEPDNAMKTAIGVFTREILSLFDENYTVLTAGGPFKFNTVRNELSAITSYTCAASNLKVIEEIKKWCNEAKENSAK